MRRQGYQRTQPEFRAPGELDFAFRQIISVPPLGRGDHKPRVILKRTSAALLPISSSAQRQTAKALGVNIPDQLLALANDVIE
jgi:hypothetical protein